MKPTTRCLAALATTIATLAAVATPASAAQPTVPSAEPTAPSAQPSASPAQSSAAAGLLDAFGRRRIVALGQVHDLRQQDEFILRLMRHPRFARTVDSVVVEFGNARYQALVDRYVAGGDVPLDALKPVWRDLVATAGAMHDGPARFFAAVRGVNRTLPRGQRVRVALGDPAFDWLRLRRASQFEQAVGQRDKVFAAAAEREARGGRRVLLLSGFMHLVRGLPLRFAGETAVRILERRAPGRVWIVLPYAGTPTDREAFERRFVAPGPRAAIRLITGALGRRPADRFLAPPPVGGGMGNPYRGLELRSVADDLISFGRCSELRHTAIPETSLRDRGYRREVDRRSRILTGRPFVLPPAYPAHAPYCPMAGASSADG
jgi:hypothetical protein